MSSSSTDFPRSWLAGESISYSGLLIRTGWGHDKTVFLQKTLEALVACGSSIEMVAGRLQNTHSLVWQTECENHGEPITHANCNFEERRRCCCCCCCWKCRTTWKVAIIIRKEPTLVQSQMANMYFSADEVEAKLLFGHAVNQFVDGILAIHDATKSLIVIRNID
jgi:hypothetical protein